MDRNIYLVTGGAGFIGSALVHHLVALNKRVRVVDDLSTGRLENLTDALDRIEFIQGDLCDLEVCRSAVWGVDCVLHQAALPSVLRSIEDPLATHRANVDATVNLLVAAQGAGCRRLVYASSSSVYGNSEVLPKVESMPAIPVSPYAVSKWAGEQYVLAFHRVYGLETVALRYFNVFGPRQNSDSPYSGVLARWMAAALAGKPLIVHGDGKQSRDFTFVENVVEANLSACTASDALCQAINIGAGVRHTLLDVIEIIGQLLNTQLDTVHAEPRSGDVRHSQADISLAEKALNYSPKISFVDGLKKTLDWWRNQTEPVPREAVETSSRGETGEQGAR